MHNYRVVYTMIGGETLTTDVYDRPENLETFINNLIFHNYATHVSSDKSQYVCINNRNVLYMEVKEI